MLDSTGSVDYCPDTGEIRWVRSGKKAGGLDKDGYMRLLYCGRRVFGHRLAWLIAHGEWPDKPIDHINGNKSDNRLCNLRLASVSQNQMNTRIRADSTSGRKGVCFDKARGKWRAQIAVHGRRIFLGLFKEKEEAAQAYMHAAVEYHREYARLG